ncbi:hypothetical protein D3C84_1070020 [compost metagenome]
MRLEHWPGWEQSALSRLRHSFTASFQTPNGRLFLLFGLVYPPGWLLQSARPPFTVDYAMEAALLTNGHAFNGVLKGINRS